MIELKKVEIGGEKILAVTIKILESNEYESIEFFPFNWNFNL